MAEPSEVECGKSGENGRRKCGNGRERVREDKVNERKAGGADSAENPSA
jgi:hypothetical protein